MPLRLRSLSLFTLASLSFVLPLYLTLGALPMAAQSPDSRRTQADQLLKQGNEQLTANQPEAALQTLQAALKLYRDLKDRAAEGQTLKSIGNAYQALKQYDQAIAHQQQALEIARELKDKNLEARALHNIGLAYEKLEKPAKAIESYEQSLTVSQSSQNIEMEDKSLANLGLVYKSLRNFSKATNYFKKRLALAERGQSITDRADALDDMCSNYWQQGDFENSIQTCQQALTLYRELKNQKVEEALLARLGLSYQSQGKYAAAIHYFQEALAVNQETKDLPMQVRHLAALGTTYQRVGKYSEGIDSLKKGLNIAREINYLDLEKDYLNLLSGLLLGLGEYAESTKYAEQYLENAKQTQDISAQVTAIEVLLINYGNMGNVDKVLNYSKEIKIIEQRIGSSELKAKALLLLGKTYNYLADRKVENGLYAAMRTELSGQFTKSRLNSFVDYYRAYAATEVKQAIQSLDQALSVVREIHQDTRFLDSPTSLKRLEVNILTEIAQSYGYFQDLKAIGYGKQALQIVQQDSRLRIFEAIKLAQIGIAYSMNLDNTQAIQFFQQSLIAARRDKIIPQEGAALNSLGSLFQSSGDLVQAEKALFEAARISETLRTNLESKDNLKVSLFEGQQTIYRTLEEVLIAQNKPEAALEVSERGRARIFIEQLRRQTEQINTTGVTFPSIQEIKQTAQQHNATLVVYSIGTDPLPGINKNQSRNLFAWIVQPTGKIEFRTVDLSLQPSSLVALVNLTRQAIGARGRRATLIVKSSPEAERISRNQQTQQLQQLHKLLIEPIASLLPTDPNQRVIFIPQGELFLVPFSALQDANGIALIEKHTILTAPSIQVLDLTRQAAAEKSRGAGTQQQAALVVGNPTMPKVRVQVGGDLEQLSNLVGAETEAEAIATLLKAKPIIGKQATKSSIVKQMANARLIHLATHGLLDDFKGLGVPGAIALAPDGTGADNDGLLTADEILDLKLNAELVVLSACDTGRGRITGDGVIGLSRSLITAGVPSIIVSLWKVPDASTAFLMTEFYRNLQQQPDKAIALRQAMLTTKDKYPDPLDWAAFTLIGEAE